MKKNHFVFYVLAIEVLPRVCKFYKNLQMDFKG